MSTRTIFVKWHFFGLLSAPAIQYLLIISLLALTTTGARGEQPSEPLVQPVITGMVTGPTSKPVVHVKVKLFSNDQTLNYETFTNSEGEFVLSHKACQTCCLEFAPPKNSGLTPAWISNIPGEATRKIVVSLRPGFEIKGRVVHNGKGLGDIIIAISPLDDNDNQHGFIHGGGWVRTASSGTFALTLAPGLKRLVISNKHYPALQPSLETRIVVTEDGMIPDIDLPAALTKGEPKP